MIKKFNYNSVKFDIETYPGESYNRIYLDKLDYELPAIGQTETIIINNFDNSMYRKYKKALDNYFNNSYTNATDKLSRMFYNTYIRHNTIENFYNFSEMYKDYKNGKNMGNIEWDLVGIDLVINSKMISEKVFCIEITAIKERSLFWNRANHWFTDTKKIMEKFKEYCIEKDKENTIEISKSVKKEIDKQNTLKNILDTVKPVIPKTIKPKKGESKNCKKLQTKSCNIRLQHRNHNEITSLYDLDGIIDYVKKNSQPVVTSKSKKIGDCWKWNGSYSQSKTGLPQISILDINGKVTTRTIRQAFYSSVSNIDLHGKGIRTKTPICGYSDCVNPDHINLDTIK